VFVIIARILSPSEIGTFVIAMIFYELARLVVVAGLPTCLTRSATITEELKDTLFITTISLACLITSVSVFFSSQIAAILGTPDSGAVIIALALLLPVAAAGSNHMALNLREFGHKSLAIRSVLSGTIGGGIALFATFHDAGLWALVYQRISIELVGATVSFWSYKWIPGRRFSISVLKSQVPLAVSLSATQLVWIALIRSQDLIIARTLGPTMVGIYRTAWKSIEMVAQGVVVPIANVSVPVLTRLQDDKVAFERAMVSMTTGAVTLALPAIVGLGLTAHDLIPIVYGQQWQLAVPVLQVLALLVIPLALNQFIGQCLTVLGKSRALLAIALIQSALAISACIVASRFGLTAIALGFVAADYLGMIAQLLIFQKVSHIGILRLVRAIMPHVAATSLMAITVLGVQKLLLELGLASSPSSVLRLSACVAVGFITYGVSLIILGGSSQVFRAMAAMRGRVAPSAPPPSSD